MINKSDSIVFWTGDPYFVKDLRRRGLEYDMTRMISIDFTSEKSRQEFLKLKEGNFEKGKFIILLLGPSKMIAIRSSLEK